MTRTYDVPTRTLDQLRSEQIAKLAEITAGEGLPPPPADLLSNSSVNAAHHCRKPTIRTKRRPSGGKPPVAVVCVENKKLYWSLAAAVVAVGGSVGAICQAMKTGCRAQKFHWRRATKAEIRKAKTQS